MVLTQGARTRLLLAVTPLLFAAGLLNDPPWKGYSLSQRVQFNTEPVRIASSLLRRGEFASPFIIPTGFSSHIAPGFPVLQAGVLRAFGDGPAGWLGLRFLLGVALGLQYALLPWLCPLMGFTRWTGLLASVLGLIAKPVLEDRWEAHIAGLFGLLLTGFACRWVAGAQEGTRAAEAGAIAAVLVYFQPIMSAVYGAWVIWSGRPFRYFSRRVLPLWSIPLLCAVPWVVRGYTTLGGLFPMRDNLGIEMYVSFNDCAPYGFRTSLRNSCIQQFHPNASFDEAAAVQALGEYRYNQDRLQKALAWIRAHPRRSAALVARRTWFFWFPSENGWKGYSQQRIRLPR